MIRVFILLCVKGILLHILVEATQASQGTGFPAQSPWWGEPGTVWKAKGSFYWRETGLPMSPQESAGIPPRTAVALWPTSFP